MLYICLTYDYELFLGENIKEYNEILFQPSQKIAELLNKYDISGTFFIDVCSAIRHEEFNLFEYSHRVKQQICDMYKQGMDIQLHIHPNWLESTYENGHWNMDVEHYKLHSYGFHDGGAEDVLKSGKNWLESSLRAIDPSYCCTAFRAGGFCLQPEEEYIKLLVNNGIFIDSSVALKQVGHNHINDYDYRKIPHNLNWHISAQNGVSVESKEDESTIFEIPVGAVRNNIFRMLTIPFEKLRVVGALDRGSGLKHPLLNTNPYLDFLRNMGRRIFGYGILSLDTRGAMLLKKDLDSIYRRYDCSSQDAAICVICHPKLANNNTLQNMEELINLISNNSEKYKFVAVSKVKSMIKR